MASCAVSPRAQPGGANGLHCREGPATQSHPPRLGSPDLRQAAPAQGLGPWVTTGHARRATRPARRTRTQSNERGGGRTCTKSRGPRPGKSRARMCEPALEVSWGFQWTDQRQKTLSGGQSGHKLVRRAALLARRTRIAGEAIRVSPSSTKPPPAGEALDREGSTARRVRGAAGGAVPPEVYAYVPPFERTRSPARTNLYQTPLCTAHLGLQRTTGMKKGC
jgi:hypothetical protein